MTTIAELFGVRPVKGTAVEKYYKTLPKCSEEVSSDRLIGIEVEVENHRLLKEPPSGVWQLTNDGSLRNNGVEWITLPIEARFAPYALRELLGESLNTDCCFSPRTSVHVHVNCQDLHTTAVMDVILLYACLEPLFFQFTGRGRAKNIYCVPIGDTDLLPFMVNRRLEQAITKWSKYSGLNILPLAEKGTVEFRHMHGTFDYDKLSRWVRLITKLFDYCIKQGTPAIRRLVSSFNERMDVFGLVADVFGDDVRLFTDLGWKAILPSVSNVKLAFMKPETLAALSQQRNPKAAYFAKG